jgi:hypothetical protein
MRAIRIARCTPRRIVEHDAEATPGASRSGILLVVMRIAPSRRAPCLGAVAVVAAAVLVGLDFTGYRVGRATPPEAHVRRYAHGIR